MYNDNFLSDSDSRIQSNPMENPTLGIRCRIVATQVESLAGRTRPVKSRLRHSKRSIRQTYDRKRAVFYPFGIDGITAVSCCAVYGLIQLQ